MRNSGFSIVAGIAVLGVSTLASAGMYDPLLDHSIEINGGSQFSVGDLSPTFTVAVPDTGGDVVGFSFIGTWSSQSSGGIGDPPDPASHTKLVILSPDGFEYELGGLGTGPAWDFDGSNTFGTYEHGPDFLLPNSTSIGDWEFTFSRDGGDLHWWSNVQITLHSIPAPPATAMLAMLALGRGRRRQ